MIMGSATVLDHEFPKAPTNHHRGPVRISRGRERHDGAVGHPEAIDPMHPQPCIGDPILLSADTARARRVKPRTRQPFENFANLFIGFHLRARGDLVTDEPRERRLTHEAAHKANHVDHECLVAGIAPPVRVDLDGVCHIGGLD
jgi:hypothetical protein